MTRPPVKVLVVGPSPNGFGGMSGVMRWFHQLPPNAIPGYRVECAVSHGGVGQRSLQTAGASVFLTFNALLTVIRTRPAVVHLLVGPRGSLLRKRVVARVARLVGSRVVVHIHSGSIEQTLMGNSHSDAADSHVKALLRSASVVATLWNGPRVGMRTHGPGALWAVVGNALTDVDHDVPVPRRTDVVFAGRLSREKGAGLLPEIARSLHAFGVRMTVAGVANDEDGVRALEEMRVMPNVELTGWLSPGDLRKLLAGSATLILPSESEALPVSVLEAMVSRCAVVGSNVGGMSALLSEGRGVLIPTASDVPEWVGAITKLLGDDAHRVEMTQRAHEWATEFYSTEAVAAQLVHAYGLALLDRSPLDPSRSNRINVLGSDVDDVEFSEAVRIAVDAAVSGVGGRCVSRNASTSISMKRIHVHRVSFHSPLLSLADGASVVLASRVLGRPIRERITGIDFADGLLEKCAEAQVPVYLLGGTADVLDSVVRRCADRYAGITIVGTHDGYYGDPDVMAEAIKDSQARVVLVAMASAQAHGFCVQYGELLRGTVLVVVGGTFDVWSGRLERAPVAWQRAGMEWAFRLRQEPGRLIWRYASTNTLFVLRVAMQWLSERLSEVRPGRRSHG